MDMIVAPLPTVTIEVRGRTFNVNEVDVEATRARLEAEFDARDDAEPEEAAE